MMKSKTVVKISTVVLFIILAFAISYAIPTGRGVGSYVVTTIAGSGIRGTLDGYKEEAQFNWPTGVTVDRKGSVYVADFANHLIRKIGVDGYVTTIAGGGIPGFADGIGREALLKGPDNITIDASSNLFFADADNFRVRKIGQDGMVTTVAGNGQQGYRDGRADKAMFGYPTGIAVDVKGNLYVADRRTHTVRKITPDGLVETIVGNGYPGFADGRGIRSHLREPIAVAVDGDGVIYIADSGNNVIRVITPEGVLSTLAGGRERGYRDGKGREALFAWPTGIAVGPAGNIYICDSLNSRIRRVTPDGVVSTVAGGSFPDYADGPGYYARFNFPTGIYVDRGGNIFVADSGNNMIRKISQGGLMEARKSSPSFPF